MNEIFGNFELQEPLGRGGMAEVFLARARSGPLVGKPIALKRLYADKAADAAARDIFLGEADLSRYLVHPNIVQTYEAGAADDTFYIAMEYVAGCDLGQVLAACRARRQAIPIDTAFFIAHALAQALQFAHTACSHTGKPLGIVHCDVTPSNVFLSQSGAVKLGDFGVAQTGALGAAVPDGLAGKPQYFAPELLLGEAPSGASDVFSLGVVLYEMLTGQLPFDGATYMAICDKIVAGRFAPASRHRKNLTPTQQAIVERALSRRAAPAPSKLDQLMAKVRSPALLRYATAEAMAQDIAAAYDARHGNPLALAGTLTVLFKTPIKSRA